MTALESPTFPIYNFSSFLTTIVAVVPLRFHEYFPLKELVISSASFT